jgi:toxin YoeB
MEIAYTQKAEDDLKFWKKVGNQKLKNKISTLIIDIQQNPYFGIGKPEPLKHELSGFWSRRINQEHRIIYEVSENLVVIHSLKGHY